MIKALFLDIDGTLLSFTTHRIPQSALDAIAQAQAKGVKVIIATGRCLPLVTIKEFKPDAYITTNGCCCYDGARKSIYKAPIPLTAKQAIAQQLSQMSEPTSMAFCADDRVYINRVTPRVEHINGMLGLPIFPVEPVEHMLQEDICEIIAYFDQEEEQRIYAPIIPECEFPRWHPDFSDIIVKGHSKQTGIDHILEHFGIDLADTMAVGDGGNDVEMLRHVAIGVAMGNATDTVKAEANDVTDHIDNDGLAKAIHKHILQD